MWILSGGTLLILSLLLTNQSDNFKVVLGRFIILVQLISLFIDCILRVKLMRSSFENGENRENQTPTIEILLCAFHILEVVTWIVSAFLLGTQCLEDSNCLLSTDIYLEMLQLIQTITGLLLIGIIFLCFFIDSMCGQCCNIFDVNYEENEEEEQELSGVEIELAKSTDRRFSLSNCVICMDHMYAHNVIIEETAIPGAIRDIELQNAQVKNSEHENYAQTNQLEMKDTETCKEIKDAKMNNRKMSENENLKCISLKIELPNSESKQQHDVNGQDQPQQTQQVLHLSCGHKYHTECITKWLKGHTNCPICKNECVVRAKNNA